MADFFNSIITWDPEIMSKALMNTAMGISIVFIVLIMISLIISLFNFIPKIQTLFSKKDKSKAEVKEVKPEVAGNAGAAIAADNSGELIAVIAAAIAASTGASTDSFVVRSIKRRRA